MLTMFLPGQCMKRHHAAIFWIETGKKLATSKAVYSINLSRVNLSEEDALAASAEVFKVLKANDEDIETTQEEDF